MKKYFILLLLSAALKVSAQSSVPAEYAYAYVGKVVSVYGFVYKMERDPKTQITNIYFGSKTLEKGAVLKLTKDYNLQFGATFQSLPNRFITVTGKVIRDKKGVAIINGDDPATSVSIRESPLASN
jgi:hypothetical protein